MMREVASFFRVLGDETRLEMLWLLMNRKELCVCDFMIVLRISQTRASRHLRILYGAGLVTDRRDGLWKYYSLLPMEGAIAADQLEMLRRSLSERPECKEILRRLSAWMMKREKATRCCGNRETNPGKGHQSTRRFTNETP